MLALMVYVTLTILDGVFKELCFFVMATTVCLTIIVQGGVFELVLWVSIDLPCFYRPSHGSTMTIISDTYGMILHVTSRKKRI